jgi:uncharacterized protein YndB with AHSA1/START domain
MEAAMNRHSADHATFTLERTLPVAPAQAFRAWADPAIKERWFHGPDEWSRSDYELDFRIGGHEHVVGGPPEGPRHTYDARIEDIVPNERIVYTYDMYLNEQRISVSMSTVEFRPEGRGTRLIFTEQDVFLDGADSRVSRERGTRDLLDNLEAELIHSDMGL